MSEVPLARLRPRWAGPGDNAGLIDLVRACPMTGAVKMYFDRAPDYFALGRLQGEGARVAVIDRSRPGEIVAAGAIASFPRVYVDGACRQAAYACDLRVRPESRGGVLVKRVYDFLTDWSLEQGWDLGFTTVMAGNAAMAGVLAGKARIVAYRHLATLRNFTVQFLLPKLAPRGLAVRTATPADVPAMVELWNRLQARKHFAPAWTARDPAAAAAEYLLAFRGDRLTGLMRIWNQEAIKRMIVLGYSPAMIRMRRWYNPLARALGLAAIPPVGQAMRYFYATHLCAETAGDLRALYVAAYNRHRRSGFLFFSTMLDLTDPLIPALDGFMTQHVDIDLFVMDPHGRYRDRPAGDRPCYFDPAIV